MDLTCVKNISYEIFGSTFRDNSNPYEHKGVNIPAINIKIFFLFSDSTLNSACLLGANLYHFSRY
jgi:hypothetical protein